MRNKRTSTAAGDTSAAYVASVAGADDGTLWTAKDAARHLLVHVKTVYKYHRTRGLPCVRVGGRIRFLRSDVLRWASARREL